ncbi:MAG TPA: H-type small acid-soluble spore protein [Clostridia bacterium]|jgi:H-type small acid-soluble spore protein|nr:H-type small acid-soluble spore protein [Clostridia bacterium]
MDYTRAQEIISSKGIINVEYNGKPVWLLNLDKEEQKAEIEFLDDTTVREKVNISELEEV